MTRLLAFLCVLLLAATMVSFASAEKVISDPIAKGMDFGDSNYMVKNGETAKFTLFASAWSLYTDQGEYYNNLDFDTDEKVTGKVTSGGSWITVTNTKNDVKIRVQQNDTMKKRTGKVKVTGNGYSATLQFTQLGRAKITSIVRKKGTMTLKFKNSSGASVHFLRVGEYSADESGYINYDEYTYKRIYEKAMKSSSYKFKVRAGYVYEIGYYPAIKNSYGGYSWSMPIQDIYVGTVSGSENYTKK